MSRGGGASATYPCAVRAGPRRAAVAVLTAAIVLTTAVGARADDPTWAQVQAAKRDVRLRAGEVASLQQALDGLEAEAARLGTIALQRAQSARDAELRLDRAKAVTAALQRQQRAAEGRAAEARRTAAVVAAQLYRSGDPTVSVWLSGRGSTTLLYRLGALARIGDSSADLLVRARSEERQAKAVGDQAAAQAAIRDDLAGRATAAANVARQAEDRAAGQVRATKARRASLVRKLAELKARSSSLQASYAAAQAAKRAAAAAGQGGGGGSLAGIGAGPDSLSPQGAQAYAAGRLGAYGWDGGQMSCLAQLWTIESGWRWNALNAGSGAYGIPQSLPGAKMATAGGDWTTSAKTQIEWGLGYIKARYSSPCGALAFETSHVPYWY